ncbi:LytTR family DNA-binding domain-containing protein [Microbulbifer thermotolerans]|uniref:DNA-binding response regulator n=1 Tax=Microbulbifer thermotolerans TaxID=252514 RepID=A0A143HQL5_MICTH|nr:LytTR family DNA-binding domain-containing protein [Microbulbifer thermotolerans]AMX03978.1 DNA-binding response regulator [Microbulbifer thermotolerans]MCX2779089.1 LytTR family DNA-binding domain-containing protein [Microbulbifer thermotolerans]MCX2782725.1 LytTR family DNA-binding domain-containing protein [Microbulbifer thermotolerans]MCX2795621.1 LytTR family DNA-binding domain-containing protein [Microbulbifer thermotolerans]MCX2800193.1 LytTR family DNA-binding domain-containing prot
MKVLIVDDEPLARGRLARQLRSLDDCELVGEAGDALDALAQVDGLDPDLVLLDIEMPGDSGLELARRLSARDTPPALIFCTAHAEFALPAFATAAVGYLLKPVSAAQLAEAIAKVRRLSKPQRKLVESDEAPQGRSRIKAVSRRGVELVEVDSIRCFIADSKYVVAHHSDGETILDESLKDLEAEFAGRFVRVHRNALVAVQHILGLRKDGNHYRVTLQGVAEQPLVSRRMLAGVKALLQELA